MNRFLQTENTLSIFTNWVEDTISIGKIDSFDYKILQFGSNLTFKESKMYLLFV